MRLNNYHPRRVDAYGYGGRSADIPRVPRERHAAPRTPDIGVEIVAHPGLPTLFGVEVRYSGIVTENGHQTALASRSSRNPLTAVADAYELAAWRARQLTRSTSPSAEGTR